MRTVLRVLARPVLHEPYSCNKPIGAKSHRSSASDNFDGAFEVLDQVLSRYMRTEIENPSAYKPQREVLFGTLL